MRKVSDLVSTPFKSMAKRQTLHPTVDSSSLERDSESGECIGNGVSNDNNGKSYSVDQIVTTDDDVANATPIPNFFSNSVGLPESSASTLPLTLPSARPSTLSRSGEEPQIPDIFAYLQSLPQDQREAESRRLQSQLAESQAASSRPSSPLANDTQGRGERRKRHLFDVYEIAESAFEDQHMRAPTPASGSTFGETFFAAMQTRNTVSLFPPFTPSFSLALSLLEPFLDDQAIQIPNYPITQLMADN